MAILVTGGAGYIGSHTCVELLKAGYDIVLLDNFSNSKPGIVDVISRLTGREFPVCAVDILHENGLTSVFRRHKIEAVVHFAGLKAVGESVKIPIDYYTNNVSGTLNLLRIMTKAGCKRIVFSSSATVYGENTNVPFREDYPTSATNPYGMTKLIVERILRDIAVSDSSFCCTLLRYFNPVGAHSSGLLGEDPNGIPNNLAPYIAQVAAGRLTCLNVYGGNYETKDGTGVRDYIHVVDLAAGHLRAIEYARSHTGAETINLGTGIGYSVLDVLHAFERAVGRKIPYEIKSRRPGDIATCFAETSKAKKLLGWQAERDIDDMCRDAWNYARSRYN